MVKAFERNPRQGLEPCVIGLTTALLEQEWGTMAEDKVVDISIYCHQNQAIYTTLNQTS